MLTIEDMQIPGLADLNAARLRTITGAETVDILRLRYRPGKRAILHVATQSQGLRREGALWFFKGDKARRIARRNKLAAHFDPETSALYEVFPQDHRMPQIRLFLENNAALMRDMTGEDVTWDPLLMRYRPGLSCTFRSELADRGPVYVKLVKDDDPLRLRTANAEMRQALRQTGLSVPRVLGVHAGVRAVVYDAAKGTSLDLQLSETGSDHLLDKVCRGLRHLWDAPLRPQRRLGPRELLDRARESAEFIAATVPESHAAVSGIVARLATGLPDQPLRPIHGDMKLEHLFLDREEIVLIDTESLSLGLADYDLAQLYARLWQAELAGLLPRQVAEPAAARVRGHAGPAFDWCLGVVATRMAKFHAQRPGKDAARDIAMILGRLDA